MIKTIFYLNEARYALILSIIVLAENKVSQYTLTMLPLLLL